MLSRGVARSFQRGGGGHTVLNNIVMAFSPRNIVGCLPKKRLTKGGGVTGTPGSPLAMPLLSGNRGIVSLYWSECVPSAEDVHV